GVDVLDDDLAISSTSPALARQIEARHLYVLAMLLADQGYLQQLPTAELPGGLSATQQATLKKELMARRLAQWAINVVAVRDGTSIMIPFEYDVNPFNGWDTDGDLTTTTSTATLPNQATERRVVWSCKYPDLILTETLAFHDRRVRDTDYDDSSLTKPQKK